MKQKFNINAIESSQQSCVSVSAKKLIWDVFFASKRRGFNLEYHFPWLDDKETVTCLSLEYAMSGRSETLAALVIKQEKIEPVGFVGLIGLVCVHPNVRGQGLSKHLMKLAEEYGRNSSLKALILWTTKQEVYRRRGFVEDMSDYFGTVTKVSPERAPEVVNHKVYGVEVRSCNEAGVPAFASEVIMFSHGLASLTVCKTSVGLSLAEWSGDSKSVMSLIEKVLPCQWSINIPEGSDLISILKENGYKLDLQPSTKRMVRFLTQEKLYYLPYISLLRRI